nr:DegT/DnrJ/EryC1/StrS family aminotransferase [uncultured Blautia sp.]
MKVNYTVLQRGFELYKEEYEEAAMSVLRSGWYVLGPEMEAFETAFAEYMGVKHCIAVNSGTDALILAFRALGIDKGDEVIVPAGTYIASVMGITENGGIPVYVDSDSYMLMDADKIESLITERTKAILPVHLYGQACQMDKIKSLAEKYKLFLVEDCAQSHGARYRRQYTGTFGDMGCFSFYPTKPLGAFGDAGAIITNNDELAEKLKMLRNYGSRKKYHNELQGVNSRMDELQAAILRIGLEHIDENTEKRRRIAEKYLKDINNPAIELPKVYRTEGHVFHLFPVMVEDRADFQNYLEMNGISTQVHYPIPPYMAECYSTYKHSKEEYPKALFVAEHEVSLPIYAGMPEVEVDYVIKAINNYQRRGGKK